MNLSLAVRKIFKEYCDNSSIKGWKYVLELGLNNFERRLWLLINIFFLIITVLLFRETWDEFTEYPIIMSLESSDIPSEKVNFPGVAICDINKISMKRVVAYAEEISLIKNVSADEIFQHLNLLGNLIEFDAHGLEDAFKFQKFLDSLDNSDYPVFKPRELLSKLTTPCEELLDSCRWGYKEVNCSKYFQKRLTFDGYCCLFNYIRPFITNEKLQPLVKEPLTQKAGLKYGLNVVINNHPEDYYFKTFSVDGIRVHIFNSDDYPEKHSGSLKDYLVGMHTETYIEVFSTLVQSLPAIKRYDIEKRQCIFPDERSHTHNYSQTDCLLDCKVRVMLSLCECIPFQLPARSSLDVCTFSDIKCMNTFREKWATYAPTHLVGSHLAEEVHNGLRCSNLCVPSCEYTKYSTSFNSVPLQSEKYTNKTILHIYQKDEFVKVYKRDIVFQWYEMFSLFGGLLSICCGLSFISVIEFLWYCTIRFFTYSIMGKKISIV